MQLQGDLFLNGDLTVELIDGFQLSANQQFLFADVGGNVTGQFDGLDEGDLVANLAGHDLFISYAGGDGNDLLLFTAVPEPGTWLGSLLAIACTALVRRRKAMVA